VITGPGAVAASATGCPALAGITAIPASDTAAVAAISMTGTGVWPDHLDANYSFTLAEPQRPTITGQCHDVHLF
jgi:hypothetical protein